MYVILAIDQSTIVLVRVTKHSCVNATPSQRNRECDLEVNIVVRLVCNDYQRLVFHTVVCVAMVYTYLHTSVNHLHEDRDRSNFIDDLLFNTYVLTCIKLSKS